MYKKVVRIDLKNFCMFFSDLPIDDILLQLLYHSITCRDVHILFPWPVLFYLCNHNLGQSFQDIDENIEVQRN